MNKQIAEKTKLTDVGARTYDPVLGKFLCVDPVIDSNLPQQNTGYAYSSNNLTRGFDPSKFMKLEKQKREQTQKRVIRKKASFLGREHFDSMIKLAYAQRSSEYRISHNKGPNEVAQDIINLYDASCTQASNGLNVCYFKGWPARSRTTFGEYFITSQRPEAVLQNDLLLEHEQAHSAQRAAFGKDFPWLYARFEQDSNFSGLPTSGGNYFEFNAGLSGRNCIC